MTDKPDLTPEGIEARRVARVRKRIAVAVVALIGLGAWIILDSNDPSACDDFRALADRVSDGDQDAMSPKTLSDLRAVAAKALDDDNTSVVAAGDGLRITLEMLDEDPNAEENLASQVRLLDDVCD